MKITRLDATRFVIESKRLRCDKLSCLYSTPTSANRRKWTRCPRCKEGLLEPTNYIVDISLHDGVGECDCPWWRCRIGPKTVRATRCKHIVAAREFCLNEILANHQKEK